MAQLSLLAFPPGEDKSLGGQRHHVRPTHLWVFDIYVVNEYYIYSLEFLQYLSIREKKNLKNYDVGPTHRHLLDPTTWRQLHWG